MISVHEYEIKPGVEEVAFERAIHEAEHRGLFELPGLIGHHFLKGLKGQRRGAYAALWIFESIEAWEKLWGPVGRPKPAEEYPAAWKTWEREILSSFLTQDPDTIWFTTYLEV